MIPDIKRFRVAKLPEVVARSYGEHAARHGKVARTFFESSDKVFDILVLESAKTDWRLKITQATLFEVRALCLSAVMPKLWALPQGREGGAIARLLLTLVTDEFLQGDHDRAQSERVFKIGSGRIKEYSQRDKPSHVMMCFEQNLSHAEEGRLLLSDERPMIISGGVIESAPVLAKIGASLNEVTTRCLNVLAGK